MLNIADGAVHCQLKGWDAVTQVFVSYSRKDREFVQKLVGALVAEKREVWLDEKDIEPTAEWLKKIFDNIDAADNFLFVITPDSVVSTYAKKEIDHAALNNKRIVPIFCKPVPDEAIPEAVAKYQRIDFTGSDDFEGKFAKVIAALDTDLDWKQAHTRLLTRASEWQREGKDSSFLLRGKDLREAERWVAKSAEKEPKPTTLQSQYILASRQSATKLQGIIIVAVAAAFLIAVGLAIYAFREKNIAVKNEARAKEQEGIAKTNEAKAEEQEGKAQANEKEAKKQQGIAEKQTATAKRNARESKARELAALSTESLNEDPERSILLGMQAVNATLRFRQPPVLAAEEALHQAILSSQRMALRGHSGFVACVAFSPDGKRLASASQDHTAKVWDAESGKELLTLSGHKGSVNSVSWSVDGKRLATGSEDQTAKVWDADTGKELLTLGGNSGNVKSVAFSSDGKLLATGNEDNSANVWVAENGKELRTLSGHKGSVNSVSWSPSGKLLAGAGEDGTMVWNLDTGKESFLPNGTQVLSVVWSNNERQLATGSSDWLAKVWDVKSQAPLQVLKGHLGDVYSVAWSPDSQRLVTGSADQTAKVWDAKTGEELLSLNDHRGVVRSVAWGPDEKLATGGEDGTVKVGDSRKKCAWGTELSTLRGHRDGVASVAWRSDGKQLATGSWDGTARVWDLETGKVLPLSGHTDQVASVAWSSDGRRLVTGSADQTAKVWDAETGKELRTIPVNGGWAVSVAWSPTDTRLATGRWDGTVELWSAETGEKLLTFFGRHEGPVNELAWDLSGKRVATASWDATAKIWDAKTGKELRTLMGHKREVYRVAWSPDGKRLATGGWDGTVRVWDLESGKALTLSGHRGFVGGVAWSPDGKHLSTGGQDLKTKVWDAKTGTELLSLGGHCGPVYLVPWSPDGKRLASSSTDTTVQVYALDLRELLSLAHSRVTRDFTAEECQRYFQSKTCPALP